MVLIIFFIIIAIFILWIKKPKVEMEWGLKLVLVFCAGMVGFMIALALPSYSTIEINTFEVQKIGNHYVELDINHNADSKYIFKYNDELVIMSTIYTTINYSDDNNLPKIEVRKSVVVDNPMQYFSIRDGYESHNKYIITIPSETLMIK